MSDGRKKLVQPTLRIAKYLGMPPNESEGDEEKPEQASLLTPVGDGGFVHDSQRPVDVMNPSGNPIGLGKLIWITPNPEHAVNPKEPPWVIIAVGC